MITFYKGPPRRLPYRNFAVLILPLSFEHWAGGLIWTPRSTWLVWMFATLSSSKHFYFWNQVAGIDLPPSVLSQAPLCKVNLCQKQPISFFSKYNCRRYARQIWNRYWTSPIFTLYCLLLFIPHFQPQLPNSSFFRDFVKHSENVYGYFAMYHFF